MNQTNDFQMYFLEWNSSLHQEDSLCQISGNPCWEYDWNVEFMVVSQIWKTGLIHKNFKGLSPFPIDKLERCLVYRDFTTLADIDVTVIIGNLVLEKSKSPKLLLLHFHSMATEGIDNNVANTLHEALQCLAGKSGFEVNCVGGSNGLRTKATDTIMRLLAHVVPSLLPCRLGACLVIPHSGGYYFIYQRRWDMKNPKLSPYPYGTIPLCTASSWLKLPIQHEIFFLISNLSGVYLYGDDGCMLDSSYQFFKEKQRPIGNCNWPNSIRNG